MKYTSCPECKMLWKDTEIEFQVCDRCGYENPDAMAGVKVRMAKGFRTAIRWIIVIIGTFISVEIYNSSTHEPSRIGYWSVFIISSFILILITSNIHNRKH